MNMLKHDHEGRPSFQLEHSDFREHYENVAVQTLQSIRRHWGLIASCVALALALAFGAIPLMPVKYSAVALIYPSLLSNEQGKGATGVSVDASSIVIGEARLVNSDAILRTVVKRLGLDQIPVGVKLPSWAPPWASQRLDWFRAMFLPETRNYSPFDRAVASLRNRLEVMKDTRSYFISISLMADSADEATAIVNAAALEYLRDKAMQRRREAVTAAEIELERQRSIYGEKHPRFLQAADGLDAARAALQATLSPEDGGRDAIATDEVVKLAIPNRTPASPKGSVILGLAIMLGLLAGISLAVWCDRPRLEPHPVALRSDIEADPVRVRRGRGKYSKRKNGVGHPLPPPENGVEYHPSPSER
jgi:uncharacterized protein involved in exopolysaccharide biosynthesis